MVSQPLVVLSAEDMLSTLLLLPILFFAPGSSEVAVGIFWSFCIFLSTVFPHCTCTQLFLVPYSFLVFYYWRRGLSRGKHCHTTAKGPMSPPVSVSHCGFNFNFPDCMLLSIFSYAYLPFSLMRCLIKSLAHFKIRLFAFLWLGFISSLY